MSYRKNYRGLIPLMPKIKPFIIEVKTDNAGTSGTNQFTIPTIGAGYNYAIKTSEQTLTNQTGSTTLTWSTPGTYSVVITGNFPRIYFNYSGDRNKIMEVQRWGNIIWSSFENAFGGCSNLDVTATDVPNLTSVTNLYGCFGSCANLENINGSISNWNTSSVIDMGGVFNGATVFNQPLDSWDTSAVTSMIAMFGSAISFNQPLNSWDTSSVTTMQNMFESAISFNKALNSWDTSAVTSMISMFRNASAFNGDISAWDVSSVTGMINMFYGAFPFNQDISAWDVSAVNNMQTMFRIATSFNQDISAWDVSSVGDMQSMFEDATSFNQDISAWDVSAVNNMQSMFEDATSFNQDISAWDVSAVSNFTNFMTGKSTANYSYYDNLLNTWSMLPSLVSSVTWDMGSIEYTAAGATAKQDIFIDSYGWTITDGGEI